ncbi:MAG: hypothetical protein V1929_04550 [bacterium]
MKATGHAIAVSEQPAFTSAQVMIAVAILGLLAAIAMPYIIMA